MKKSTLIIGVLIGIIAPFLGIAAGLQIHPMLGNIFCFPFVLISSITDQSFGEMTTFYRSLGISLSVLIWVGVVFLFSKLIGKKN
jgi:hypothetical protein